MRFDRTRSPSNINEGRGWTEKDALSFLIDHEFEGLEPDASESYLRYKQFAPGEFIETVEAAPGVTLILCQKSA